MWVSTFSWLHSLLKQQQTPSIKDKENDIYSLINKSDEKISLNDAIKIATLKEDAEILDETL